MAAGAARAGLQAERLGQVFGAQPHRAAATVARRGTLDSMLAANVTAHGKAPLFRPVSRTFHYSPTTWIVEPFLGAESTCTEGQSTYGPRPLRDRSAAGAAGRA